MAGLYNSEIRDYCGEETSMTKLSHHFSKDFTFQQEGIHNNNDQDTSNNVPTSFNFHELLKNANSQSLLLDNPKVSKKTVSDTVTSNNSPQIEKVTIPEANYFLGFGCAIPFTAPRMKQFVPPAPSVVAKQWAESELSKYDHISINEEDLKKLSENGGDPKIRFLDVLQNMTITEEQDYIDVLNDNETENGKGLLYDLDEDLKQMRHKIDTNTDTNDPWSQFEKWFEEQKPLELVFNKINPYLSELQNKEDSNDDKTKIDEILKEGIKLYKDGYFSKATLAFEAVVQMDSKSETGWSYLALSLSENEQDDKAIIACHKCLELNKNNREVLLSMARIHCNEMNLSSTIACLEQWLLAHPKYSDLATVGQEAVNNFSMWDDTYDMTFESSGKFAIIDEQLQMALKRNQLDIDPELEIAAGTLCHAIQDYERAMTRFEAAVSVIKDNACLWNKLGTAYCNSGNYEKSINAYNKALELAPGFTRAECNLGVAYYNMECYSDAIKHAIKAYKIQHPVNNSESQEVESDPIWTLIRMSSFKLNRPDLDLTIYDRDLESLSKEFSV